MEPARIFIESPLNCDESVELPEAASHHINKVLRMKPGQKIQVFNGTGGYYTADISTVDKRIVTVVPVEYINEERESNMKITLVQGISRSQHMDYTIQKAIELGVVKIVPLVTEFTNVNLQGKRIQNKLKHWRAIIIHACEQCRRTRIPEITSPISFSDWLDQDVHRVRIILVPGSGRKLTGLTPTNPDISVLSGPEGGFSETEVVNAVAAGNVDISLGPRILRTETAAVTAISAIQVLWGDAG